MGAHAPARDTAGGVGGAEADAERDLSSPCVGGVNGSRSLVNRCGPRDAVIRCLEAPVYLHRKQGESAEGELRPKAERLRHFDSRDADDGDHHWRRPEYPNY